MPNAPADPAAAGRQDSAGAGELEELPAGRVVVTRVMRDFVLLTSVLTLAVLLGACDGVRGGIYLARAKVRHQQNELDEAIELYRKGIELQPRSAFAYNNLGLVLRDNGQSNEAIEAYRRCIELRPDFAEAYNNLGNALHGSSRLDDAIDAYQNAIKLQPYFAEAHYNLGLVLRQVGREEEAQRELAEAERLGYKRE